jgi:putative PEP-CTERM system TPR-repeat lipoprotein
MVLSGCGKVSTEEMLSKGNQALASKDYRTAAIEFKTALQSDPKLLEARLGLARISLQSRNFQAAVDDLEKVVPLIASTDAETLKQVNLMLARAYHQHDSDARLMSLQAGGSAEILYYQAYHLAQAGRSQEISALIDTASFKEDGFYIMASMVERSGREEASKLLAEMNAFILSKEKTMDPTQLAEASLLQVGLGMQAQSQKDILAGLERYYGLVPDDLTRRLQYAHVLVLNDQFGRARPVLEPLVKKLPQHGLINEILSMIEFNDKNYPAARSAATLASVANPNSVAPRLVAAYSAVQMNDPKAALDNLAFVMDKLPEGHPAHSLFVRLKADTGDIDEAAKMALSLSGETAQNVALMSGLGLEKLRRGDTQGAMALAEKAASGKKADPALGLLQLSLNQREAAFETLESAYAKDPASAEAGNGLATAYLSTQRYSEALSLADEWEKAGKVAQGAMLRGIALSRQGHTADALAQFQKVLTHEQKHFTARAGVIETMVSLGRESDATAQLKEWISDPDMLGLFRHYASALNAKRAEAGMLDAVKQLDAWIDTGVVKGDMAKFISAQTNFLARNMKEAQGRLLALSASEVAKRPDYWLLRSTIAEDQNDLTAAKVAYKSWMAETPSDPMPLLGLIRILLSEGASDEALSTLDAQLTLIDDKTPGLLLRAQILMQKGDFEAFKRAVFALPPEAKQLSLGQAMVGVQLVLDGSPAEALPKLAAYVQENGSEDFLRWQVAALEETKNMAGLEKALSEFLQKKPESGIAHFMWGNHLAGMSRYAESADAYQKALRFGGDKNSTLLNNLAYVLQQDGKADVALPHAQKAVAMAPKNPSFVDTLVLIQIDLKDVDGAKRALREFAAAGGVTNAALEATQAKLQGI